MNLRNANGLLLVSWIIFFLASFVVPNAPFDYPLLSSFVSMVGSVVPAITQLRTVSPIADVAQTYWAVLVVVSLALLPLYFRMSDEQVRPLHLARRAPGVFRIAIVVPICLLIYAIFLPFIGQIGRVMLGSRLGLGVIGGLVLAGIPFMIRASVTWWRYQSALERTETRDGQSHV